MDVSKNTYLYTKIIMLILFIDSSFSAITTISKHRILTLIIFKLLIRRNIHEKNVFQSNYLSMNNTVQAATRKT